MPSKVSKAEIDQTTTMLHDEVTTVERYLRFQALSVYHSALLFQGQVPSVEGTQGNEANYFLRRALNFETINFKHW